MPILPPEFMTSDSSTRLHSIKLKGPWSVTLLPAEGADCAPETVTVHLPAEWRDLFGETAGRAVFERRFNRPTGLTDGHRVRILLRGLGGLPGVRLNDQALTVEVLGAEDSFVEITGRMSPHNLLRIEIEFDPQVHGDRPGGLWQPVLLQIEEPDVADP